MNVTRIDPEIDRIRTFAESSLYMTLIEETGMVERRGRSRTLRMPQRATKRLPQAANDVANDLA